MSDAPRSRSRSRSRSPDRRVAIDYRRLPTERVHPRADDLDHLSTRQLVSLLLDEEQRAARAVRAEARAIAEIGRAHV